MQKVVTLRQNGRVVRKLVPVTKRVVVVKTTTDVRTNVVTVGGSVGRADEGRGSRAGQDDQGAHRPRPDDDRRDDNAARHSHEHRDEDEHGDPNADSRRRSKTQTSTATTTRTVTQPTTTTRTVTTTQTITTTQTVTQPPVTIACIQPLITVTL